MTIVAQTELDAVNHIIGSIGTAPLTSLAGSLGVDATMAQNALHREVRKFCARGWYFNTEHDYPLTADASTGIITPGATILSVDFSTARYPTLRVTKRGTQVYDLKNHTYVFTLGQEYKATVKLLLQYDELPEAAKIYTMVNAGKKFQSDVVGDTALYQFDAQDAQDAWVDLLDDESQQADESIFGDNYLGTATVLPLIRNSTG